MAKQADELDFGTDGPYGRNYASGRPIEKAIFHVLRLGGVRVARPLSRIWPPLGRMFGFKPSPVNNLVWLAVGGDFVPWRDLDELDGEKQTGRASTWRPQ